MIQACAYVVEKRKNFMQWTSQCTQRTICMPYKTPRGIEPVYDTVWYGRNI